MSSYTTQVRAICEKYAGTGMTVKETIQAAIPKVFDFEFPIFDESYRNVLCTKILMHYYTREIGEETVGLWKLRLETTLNEIMPYYNKMYESANLEFNPLHDVDVTTTDKRTTVGEGTGRATGSGSGKSASNATAVNMYSETPQGGLNGLESGKYLTTATKDTSDNTSTSTSNTESTSTTNNTTTDDYIRSVVGKAGTSSYAKMLIEYRKSLINVDQMVINELQDLFMLIW